MGMKIRVLHRFVAKFVLIAGLSLSWTAGLTAGDHPHDGGPHGGIVLGFGDNHHMEAKFSGGNATFYVLDGDAKAVVDIGKHQGGSVTIIVPGKGQKVTKIEAGPSFKEITVDVAGKGATGLVKLKVGTKTVTGKFKLN